MTEKVDFSRMGMAEKAKEIKEIGVGMLGYGFMGKAHSNAYIRMPMFMYPPPAKPKLMAICGRNKEAVAESAKRYGYETCYTDWRKLVKDSRVELVDNSFPNELHAEPCITAAESGKHVLCEKPLAKDVKEAREMYEVAERAKVKHMVGFNYRFIPAVILAKRLIQEGYVGKVLQYRAVYLQDWIMDPNVPLVWRLQKKVAGAGSLGDLGAHIIDLARFLVDEVSSVCALTETFVRERPLLETPAKKGKVEVDDAFISMAKFKNGAIGTLEASRFCAGKKNYEKLEIHGTEGSIEFNLERLNELKVYSRKDPEDRAGFKDILVTENVHPFMKYWWPPGHIIGWEHTFVNEIYHFIDCIVSDRSVAPFGATFFDGVKCQQILAAVTESAEKERWITVPSGIAEGEIIKE